MRRVRNRAAPHVALSLTEFETMSILSSVARDFRAAASAAMKAGRAKCATCSLTALASLFAASATVGTAAAIATAAVAIAASPTSLHGQSAVRLGGVVHDAAGTPIPGATVLVEGTNLRTSTDSTGRFVFSALQPGRYHVRVERLGYTTFRAMQNAGDVMDITLVARAIDLGGVTVIGSGRDAAEVREQLRTNPGSVANIEPFELRATRQANLPDILRFTPGVFAQARFGAADEAQISIRGSGLRNNFHLRGLTILVNGMPYRNADGFSDFESIELLTAQSVQVYKAASAFRFGGSTLGGAVDIETKTGYTSEPINVNAQGGAYGFFKGQASSGAVSGPFNYYASYARTQVDGYRDWSAQKRDRVNLHAGYVLSKRFDARAFYLYANVSEQLPGSLTRGEFDATPDMAVPTNAQNRWGRDYQLHHLGTQLRAQISPSQRLEIAPYIQYRDIVHPIFQVIDQISRDFGTEVRYQNNAAIGDRANTLSAGVQFATGTVDNKQYVNSGGNEGALTKDQLDRAGSTALYVEDRFNATSKLSAVIGLRYATALRRVEDRFLSNGDQTDERDFNAFTPRLGVIYDLPAVHGQLYANASRTYEPPLLLELNSLAVPGFVDVKPQDARQLEIGSRGAARGWTWDVALYNIEIRDEILNVNVTPFPTAQFTVPAYRNAERTRHRGIEAGAERDIASSLLSSGKGGDRLSARAAYTLNRFTFTRDSLYQGNRLPGAPDHVFDAELVYRHPSGLTLRPSAEWVTGKYFANSANTVSNEGWVTFNTRGELLMPHYNARIFVEARNITDRRYSAAVTVDDAAGRHFLPADRRAVYAGLQWQH